MTYRQKLLLKRLLITLGILLVVALLVLLIGFSYLGRYVVYTENGAHFSFSQDTTAEETLQAQAPVSGPENPVLVTGDSILEDFALADDEAIVLEDYEVNGLIVDYDTLKDGSTLNAIDFTETEYNTLVLELRANGSEILNTEPVQTLMNRAESQEVHLIAMMSCLDDREYALEHHKQALPIEGGALWVSSGGSYWLTPTNEEVQDYLVYMILTLSEMGFDEVILNNFYFPESDYIVYDTGESTRAELMAQAYQDVANTIGSRCTLGLFVSDPDAGHQAFDYAEHLYVYMSSGSDASDYSDANPDRYIVYITDSHDTRFENHGKIQADRDADFIPETEE